MKKLTPVIAQGADTLFLKSSLLFVPFVVKKQAVKFSHSFAKRTEKITACLPCSSNRLFIAAQNLLIQPHEHTLGYW